MPRDFRLAEVLPGRLINSGFGKSLIFNTDASDNGATLVQSFSQMIGGEEQMIVL
jgi:hypothetical protein